MVTVPFDSPSSERAVSRPLLRRSAREGTRAHVGAWAGVLAVAATSAWLGVVGLRSLSGAGTLTRTLTTAGGNAVAPAVLAFIALLVVAERRWPAEQRPLLARAHLVDVSYFALTALVVIPLLALVQTGFAVEVVRHEPALVLGRLPIVPRLVVVLTALAAIDAVNWASHVANHRSAALWRLHALHHSQEEMSLFTTFRTHPLVHATYLAALLPMVALDATRAVPASALIAYGCLVILPHANVRWDFGPLDRVFVSPAYHRLHHASTPLEGRATVNFGFVLSLWDQLARVDLMPSGREPVTTGLAGRPVPVEQAVTGSGVVPVVLAQLAQPFRLHATTEGKR